MRGAQPFGDFAKVRLEIAGVVELIDKVLRDQPIRGGGQRKWQLLRERLAQALAAGNEVVEVIVFAFTAAGHRFPLAEQFRGIGALRCRVVLKDIGEVGVELLAKPLAGRRCRAVVEIVLRAEVVAGRLVPGCALAALRRAWQIVIRLKFEQRVLFDFLGDELIEFEMRHLQQLDRLHQLWRHHQGLGLAQMKAGGQCHADAKLPRNLLGRGVSPVAGVALINWPKNCLSRRFGQAWSRAESPAKRSQRLKLSPR
ncbi:hypothetical protein D9M70_514330 [compost metagenome]